MKLAKQAVDIGLLVRDIDACLRFYCETLGFPKIEERLIGDRVQHRVQIGGTLLKLYGMRTGAPPPATAGRDAQAGYRYLTIEVDDAYEAARELESRGAVFLAPPHPNSAGDTVASFEDPEGNTIEIFSARSG